MRDQSLDTRLVHAGARHADGAVVTPIYQSAMYLSRPGEAYHEQGYIRLSTTPNHDVLGERLAAIESAESAIVAASGMAAISAAVLAFAGAGDRVMTQHQLYGGTHGFFADELRAWNIGVDRFDPADPTSLDGAIRPETKVLYCETISNPLMSVGDLRALASFARERGLVSIIDNTFASPINFRPVEHGFDVSVHSATKYLNGHSDIVAGCAMGSRERVEPVLFRLNHLGGCLDPHAAFLFERGLKTLGLRVRRQNDTAMALARALEAHPQVSTVNYPGLESHPGHGIATDLFVERSGGGYGGMLSAEIGETVEQTQTFMDALTIPLRAPSLGGVESLVSRPAVTSHAGLTPEERRAAGISDRLVRISVGIEDARDLIADFERALG